jgi:hypothetical protein
MTTGTTTGGPALIASGNRSVVTSAPGQRLNDDLTEPYPHRTGERGAAAGEQPPGSEGHGDQRHGRVHES